MLGSEACPLDSSLYTRLPGATAVRSCLVIMMSCPGDSLDQKGLWPHRCLLTWLGRFSW